MRRIRWLRPRTPSILNGARVATTFLDTALHHYIVCSKLFIEKPRECAGTKYGNSKPNVFAGGKSALKNKIQIVIHAYALPENINKTIYGCETVNSNSHVLTMSFQFNGENFATHFLRSFPSARHFIKFHKQQRARKMILP